MASLVFYACSGATDVTDAESWLAAVAALAAVLALTVTAMQAVILADRRVRSRGAKVGLDALLSALIVAVSTARSRWSS